MLSSHLCFLFWKHFVSPFIDWQLKLWKINFFLWSGYDFPIWAKAGEASMVSAHSSFCRLPLISCDLIYQFWGLFPMLLESFSGNFPNPACLSIFPIIYSISLTVPSFRWGPLIHLNWFFAQDVRYEYDFSLLKVDYTFHPPQQLNKPFYFQCVIWTLSQKLRGHSCVCFFLGLLYLLWINICGCSVSVLCFLCCGFKV